MHLILIFQQSGVTETPQRRGSTEPSPEPEWKGNIQLRKVRQSPGPVKGRFTVTKTCTCNIQNFL